MFNKVKEEDIRHLNQMLPGRVSEGNAINEDYYHDELGTAYGVPDVLVKVLCTEDVSKVMQYAYSKDIPVVVRGSGTGLVGGAVATHGGIMLDTSLMKKVLELDENNLTVTVQTGILLMELAAWCDERGYPPSTWATPPATSPTSRTRTAP